MAECAALQGLPRVRMPGHRSRGRASCSRHGPDADRWFEVIALLEGNHPHHADHDYLWLLGVQPDLQGRGVGTAMIGAVLDRADQQGVPAYLEATSPTTADSTSATGSP